jgi:molybdate transport system substrate-binding protein
MERAKQPSFMKATLAPFVPLFLSLLAPACAERLTVLAAASLSDALTEGASIFETQSSHTLRFNFAGSGALARQVMEGAPADIFLSADEVRIDQLEEAGLIRHGTRRIFLKNLLVLVVAEENDPNLSSLADLTRPSIRRIVIGDPATVPAGTYAKEHLQKTGLWTSVADKLVPVDSVRAALAAVEMGNADAGFVYRTDALHSKKVRLAIQIPQSEGPRMVYPAVVLNSSKSPDAAEAFVAWLLQPDTQALFARYGFIGVTP